MMGVESESMKNLMEDAEEEPQLLEQKEEGEVEEEAMCRICHADALPVSSLVSPCRCSGTMAYVHSACLRQWVLRRGLVQCELCGHDFQARFEQRLVSRKRQMVLYKKIVKRVWRRFLAAMAALYSRKVVVFALGPMICALIFLAIYLGVATNRDGFWPTLFAYKTVRNVSCFFSPSSVGLYAISFLSSVGLAMLRALNPEPCSTVLTFFSASIVLSFMTHALISHTAPSQYHLSSDGHLVPGPAPLPVPVIESANVTKINVTAENAVYKLTEGVSLQLPIPLGRFYALALFVSSLVLVYPLYRVVVHTRTNIRVHLSYITFENYSKSKEATERKAEATVGNHCSDELESQSDDGVEGAMSIAAPQVAVPVEGEGDSQGDDGKASDLANGKTLAHS